MVDHLTCVCEYLQTSDAKSGWLLSSVTVENTATGTQKTFTHNNWVGPRDGGCSVELK